MISKFANESRQQDTPKSIFIGGAHAIGKQPSKPNFKCSIG
jgi:hypothetical protein